MHLCCPSCGRASIGIVLLALCVVVACSSSVPRPPSTVQPASALVIVDFPAPPARVEFVPQRPDGKAAWIRGEWQWQGRRWGWKPGVWVVPPEGASYAPWTLTRSSTGQLYYAAGAWRSADGRALPSPPAFSRSKGRSTAVINVEGSVEPTGQDSVHAGAGAGADEGVPSHADDGRSPP
jgi:hypothetical protein